MTKRFLKAHSLRLSIWVLLVALSVLLTMTTALSVSDFLRLLFNTDEEVLTNLTARQPLQILLDKLYLYLISFGQQRAILLFAGVILAAYTLKSLMTYLSSVEIAIIRSKVVRDIRNTLIGKVLHLPMAYYANNRKGDMMARFSGDLIEYDENILGSLQLLVTAALSMLLYISMLAYISLQLTLFVICMLPLVVFVISGISRKLKRQSAVLQKHNSHLMSMIEETIMGLKIIKAYTAIDFSNRRFVDKSDKYTRLSIKVYRRVNLASPLSEFLSSIIVICILLFGSYLIFNKVGELSPELFISYIIMFVLVIEPAKNFTTAISQIKKGSACADRIKTFLDEDEGPTSKPMVSSPYHRQEGEAVADAMVEFCNVDFVYRDVTTGVPQKVLDNISLVIKRGMCVAIVGGSGGGKSTMADLVSRFYDVSRGAVLVEGRDVRTYALADLRSRIGVVAQDTILFNDTIRNNIAFGYPEASDKQIEEAARIANAHDFIVEMPEGYNTRIGDGGEGLSGGQRQRISIARAVLRQPEILILDEATSALDTESERLVQTALDQVLKGRTSIVIAHRLSTIVNADLIVVLEHGKIVECGTHDQLCILQGRYYELVQLQKMQ